MCLRQKKEVGKKSKVREFSVFTLCQIKLSEQPGINALYQMR